MLAAEMGAGQIEPSRRKSARCVRGSTAALAGFAVDAERDLAHAAASRHGTPQARRRGFAGRAASTMPALSRMRVGHMRIESAERGDARLPPNSSRASASTIGATSVGADDRAAAVRARIEQHRADRLREFAGLAAVLVRNPNVRRADSARHAHRFKQLARRRATFRARRRHESSTGERARARPARAAIDLGAERRQRRHPVGGGIGMVRLPPIVPRLRTAR